MIRLSLAVAALIALLGFSVQASATTVFIDFEGLSTGTVVDDEFAASGVTFFGDSVFAVGDLDLVSGNALVSTSPTPPLGLSGLIGILLASPATEISLDFALDPTTTGIGVLAGIFDSSLTLLDSAFVPGNPGSDEILEGTVAFSLPGGFDFFAIVSTSDGLTPDGNLMGVDNLSIRFVPEPNSIILLGIGVIALIAGAYTRRSRLLPF